MWHEIEPNQTRTSSELLTYELVGFGLGLFQVGFGQSFDCFDESEPFLWESGVFWVKMGLPNMECNIDLNYELILTSNLTCCLFERIIIINVTHHIYFIWKYLLLIFVPLTTPPSKLAHIKIQKSTKPFTIESYRKLMGIYVATYIWPHCDITIRLSPRIDKYRLYDEIIEIDSGDTHRFWRKIIFVIKMAFFMEKIRGKMANKSK